MRTIQRTITQTNKQQNPDRFKRSLSYEHPQRGLRNRNSLHLEGLSWMPFLTSIPNKVNDKLNQVCGKILSLWYSSIFHFNFILVKIKIIIMMRWRIEDIHISGGCFLSNWLESFYLWLPKNQNPNNQIMTVMMMKTMEIKIGWWQYFHKFISKV